jgi:hypothetical protein
VEVPDIWRRVAGDHQNLEVVADQAFEHRDQIEHGAVQVCPGQEHG